MAGAAKKRTNVTLDPGLVAEARGFGLNVSAVAEKALDAAVRAERAKAWLAENKEAIAQREAFYEAHGMPLAAYRLWDPE